MKQPTGNGWLPYVAPMLAFLMLVEVSRHVPARLAWVMLSLRVAIPLGLLVFFRWRGAYPELVFRVSKWNILDGLIGIALAVMWIVPFVLFPRLRPDPSTAGFDPHLAGAVMVPLMLSVRMLGYAAVTPLMEELFMRSFLMRYADVYDTDRDFRSEPIARFTLRSFLVVVVVFLATHRLWEWWVMLPWAVLTTGWFYYRKDLFGLVVVHAATNASILLAAITLDNALPDGLGGTLSLWFLV